MYFHLKPAAGQDQVTCCTLSSAAALSCVIRPGSNAEQTAPLNWPIRGLPAATSPLLPQQDSAFVDTIAVDNREQAYRWCKSTNNLQIVNCKLLLGLPAQSC